MPRTPQQMRDDLRAIWNAGVDGVRVDRLMHAAVSLTENALRVEDVDYPLNSIKRIVVIGGGKASGAMAETLETILEPLFEKKEIVGWVNVPDDCAKPLRRIILHPARAMGINEPTEAAVAGTAEMLRMAENLTKDDLCICLLSGGGSALLPAPVPEITLGEKLEITRFLSESGATIQELNTVRKQISRIKGGGLKRICRKKRLVSLILSDVLGDPLDVIASGPTVDDQSTASEALDVLSRFRPEILHSARASNGNSENHEDFRSQALLHIADYLRNKMATGNRPQENGDDTIRNVIIGNNSLAVESAGEEALRRGYSYALYSSPTSEGLAEKIGIHLAQTAIRMRSEGPDCLIHGGEPVVRLASPEKRGLGGRNQQLVLAALICLFEKIDLNVEDGNIGIAVLSGGTDGEDGPTDAAGAWIDPIFWRQFEKKVRDDPSFDPKDFLGRNDAYRFFEPFGTLLKTGATGTNVCDLRVVLVDRIAGDE